VLFRSFFARGLRRRSVRSLWRRDSRWLGFNVG
jgi:hypothetical protein